MKRYKLVMFLQGDDYLEFESTLDAGGTEAAVAYLAQWEPDHYSDMTLAEPPHGSQDTVVESADGQYVLSYHTRKGYAGLCRIVHVDG